MPRIFDNMEQPFLPALQNTLKISEHADFCVGYFNLRGWGTFDSLIDTWSGSTGSQCRLLIGMQTLPMDALRELARLERQADGGIDQASAVRIKKQMAQEFRDQLTIGTPTNADQATLRHLSDQLRSQKVVVKLFLRHQLHAKLYLLYRADPNNPITGFLGSSNLTMAGLQQQGELNVDVVDSDAVQKLERWFADRWNDRFCFDITEELAAIIDQSWAREESIPPYYIYLKMAYHLSQEARAGLAEFHVPRDFGNRLFAYQQAAVQIAAHHVNTRGGVIIGDVVGLGKTLMATALARIFQDDHSWETLIICPKNLVAMWQEYRSRYRLIADIVPISQVEQRLANLRRYRLIIIDESHNLRNRERVRYHAIQEYIEKNESRCILLTATPYNKTYLDLSAQLRLFVPEDRDIGIRPENLIQSITEPVFVSRYQCGPRTLAAFEKSESIDDWRDLMRLYLIRRTRSFIQQNYAKVDTATGRRYLTLDDGTKSYFPARQPITLRFAIGADLAQDPYARLYSDTVVNSVNTLFLPRYGLGNYLTPRPQRPPTPAEEKVIKGLTRSGNRLLGFCRTNLFKRLESGGPAFLQSIERHVMRNFIVAYALENGLEVPIGTQEVAYFDTATTDGDLDAPFAFISDEDTLEEMSKESTDEPADELAMSTLGSDASYRQRANDVYATYATRYRQRFQWIKPDMFIADLQQHLLADAHALIAILQTCGDWDARQDTKLRQLTQLLTEQHPAEKVLIFTQFADTAAYLATELQQRGITHLAQATGNSQDPTALARRFSPVNNDAVIEPAQEIRVLVTTDVLSEGQNLQDCAIIVNYDLPWAIIRLIQRAGRVDRIGQKANTIRCYSFMPADGVEVLLHLRARVRQRLQENREVVGTDEAFFEDELNTQTILDIYNEKSDIYDGDADTEIDLSSQAYQIWKNATDARPELASIIPALPDVVFSAKEHLTAPQEPDGVLLYMKTTEGNDALAYIDASGQIVTQSQAAILRIASCRFDAQGLPRAEQHHALVQAGVAHLVQEEFRAGGQLGRPNGARFRVYQRLHDYAIAQRGTLWESPDLERALDDIYRSPLLQSATDILNRQLRLGIRTEDLARLVIDLRDDNRLCVQETAHDQQEPRIVCSLGLISATPVQAGQ